MQKISEQICTHFSECKFCDDFKSDIDEFFENSKNLTHLQYLAVSSKLNDKSILDRFKTQIDEIWDNSRNLLTNFTINSIKDIANFMQTQTLNFENLKFASGETHNHKKSVLIASANDRKFVYKPYSCSYLLVLNAIFDTLKPHLKYNLEIFPKILIQNDDFTVVEFLKAQNEIKSKKSYYVCNRCSFRLCNRI